MPKIFILKVGDKEIRSSELTYNDLVVLFKQFIDKNNRTPKLEELIEKNNMPSYSKVFKILNDNDILSYKEFCSILGDNKMLCVNGVYKPQKDITYDDLVILYKEYIDKNKIAPTSIESTIENNLPNRKIINSILEKEGIIHDEFLALFGVLNGKRRYKQIKIGDVFGRWKVIKKGNTRSSGKNQNIPFWICQCSCGSNIIREISENALQTGQSKSCGCLQSESISNLKGTYRKQNFEEWCIKNNHKDYLNRWDYEKNNKKPSEISYISHEKVYFKCPCGKHESSLYQLSSIQNMKELRCKYCFSFAQRFIDTRGADALKEYWDYEKNTENPWKIAGSSRNKVWLKCTETSYHGSYQISRDDAIRGVGCPFCNHSRIHPKDSFGQMLIDRYGEDNFKKIWNTELNIIDPFTIAPSTRKYKVWLNCIDVDYHKATYTHPNDVKNHSGYCHYCAKIKVCKEDSLGYNFPIVLDVWSEKNRKTPYEYFPNSNSSVWWKCCCGKHEDFKRKISDAKSGDFGCPKCSQESSTSKLQTKVAKYIEKKYGYNLLHENECTLKPRNPLTNSLLRYDNEIPDLKLIVEVNGIQHYEICGFTYMTARYYRTTPDEELKKYQERDRYKEKYAIDHGYNYLKIPYWSEKNETYKNLIDDKIKELLQKVA